MEPIRQIPDPGSRVLHYRGDLLRIRLVLGEPAAGTAWVRTNVGSASVRRQEIVQFAEAGRPVLARDWHDIPMRQTATNEYSVALPLLEVGQFEVKAFFLPAGQSDPAWPPGDNVSVKVEPAEYVSSCTIYNAFVRQFLAPPVPLQLSVAGACAPLEAAGYSVIPPSGTFRNLTRQVDFIVDKLGFRILLLLPIHPPPTTYARMGRFGSPYAVLDFMDVDPALAEFDRKTTPLDQFRELADAIHARAARLFIDIPVNHTGWASWLQIHHPNWFVRNEDRSFQSPGAWGVTWEDLSKLDFRRRDLWQYMAEVFLYWCRQGVDGFRCDAGYMVPMPVWQYIVAKVRDEFPDTVFLLEGLGGPFTAVESLLSAANLNWVYSELFQTHGQQGIEQYVPFAGDFSEKRGLMVHFAETHDNTRLAASSPIYARFRTALSALCGTAGGFGITNGLEWLATHRIDVHEAPPLNWNSTENQVEFIARLTTILQTHPAFEAGAATRMIHSGQYGTIALLRSPRDGSTGVLVVANFNDGRPAIAVWPADVFPGHGDVLHDLLTGRELRAERHENTLSLLINPHECLCLTTEESAVRDLEAALRAPRTLPAAALRQTLKAKVLEIVALCKPDSDYAALDLESHTALFRNDPMRFIADSAAPNAPPLTAWVWPRDLRRLVPLPPGDILLVSAPHPFQVRLCDGERVLRQERSIPSEGGTHYAAVLPPEATTTSRHLEVRISVSEPGRCRHDQAPVLHLAEGTRAVVRSSCTPVEVTESGAYALCTNGRGAMSQVRGQWATIESQYDAILAANLHPDYPVDHHVMFTRCRAWLVYRGYSSDINSGCSEGFWIDEAGRAVWQFLVPCGMGKAVRIQFALELTRDRNQAVLSISRLDGLSTATELPPGEPVRIVLRPDLEDRNCHTTTQAYLGPETAWPHAIRPTAAGFVFAPAPDRMLDLSVTTGTFSPAPEWSYMVPHPFEASRGLNGSSDLFSPGFFTIPVAGGQTVALKAQVAGGAQGTAADASLRPAGQPACGGAWSLEKAASRAISDFIVKRDDCLTVLAGFPWFLDWGRDTMICLRGIIADGRTEDAKMILREFARFEENGTLPNVIRGSDQSNRDTSDAPLWFLIACSDLLQVETSGAFLDLDCGGRTLRAVLQSIAGGYMRGTPNGIVMDPESGLIFSPSHFTWMDTNHPAGTPREGYPIEIQALWHGALDLLARIDRGGPWGALRPRVAESIRRYFAQGDHGYLADCLHARRGQSAAEATPDDALRPNQLLAITLGAVNERALGASILQACQELLTPGAIRSLADRPVAVPIPVSHRGSLLNDPYRPYWGQYRGDEDTRRKPAYHNGTAWTWLFPSYCEALLGIYGDTARSRARALLASTAAIMDSGCIGHVPEVVDGDIPHRQGACGAQAWGATELLRVWKLLA